MKFDKQIRNVVKHVFWGGFFQSSQVYLYSTFHNIDCIKAASQYQSITISVS